MLSRAAAGIHAVCCRRESGIMPDRILLFIPAYNCEKQVPRVLDQLLDPKVSGFVSGCIVVNNRSTDGTEAAVLSWMTKHPSKPVRLLRNNENYGLGGSHKVAFQYAIAHKYDYLVVLHGDDQGDARDLAPLIASGKYRNYDCCLGSRFMKGSRITGYSPLRIFGNYGFNSEDMEQTCRKYVGRCICIDQKYPT